MDFGRAPGRANVGDKVMTLLVSALARGDCIDDADVLRIGRTAVMVFFMIALLNNDGRDTFISLHWSFYVLLVMWNPYLGFGLMNRPDPDLWQ